MNKYLKIGACYAFGLGLCVAITLNLLAQFHVKANVFDNLKRMNYEIQKEGFFSENINVISRKDKKSIARISNKNYLLFSSGSVDIADDISTQNGLTKHFDFYINGFTGAGITFKKIKPDPYYLSKTEKITADVIEGEIKLTNSELRKLNRKNYSDMIVAEIKTPKAEFRSKKFPEYNSELYGVTYVAPISSLTNLDNTYLPMAPEHSELKIDTLSFKTVRGDFDLTEVDISRGIREDKRTQEKNVFKFKVANGLGSFSLYGYNDKVRKNETIEHYMDRINARYILSLGGVAFMENPTPFYRMMFEKGLLSLSDNGRNLMSRINFEKGEPTFNGRPKDDLFEVLAKTANGSLQ
ncbi:hypothetical protein [Succinivibrio dextrinosolvens]|uniref:hypothetical protein n=1 Tax=Succinivibrio dextrinosolvens TaxID=83771 RepID=UPI00192227BE|nr:hypothetical protein [Succinivibrio dextrinosolvens]